MIGLHVEFEMKPGTEHVLLEWKAREGALQRRTPGFIKRSMSRNAEQPTIFYYVSYWRTKEQMLGFLHSPQFEQVITSVGVRDAIARRERASITEVFDGTGTLPNG